MARLGFVLHPQRIEARELASQTMAWLIEQGHQCVLCHEDAALVARPELGVDESAMADQLDLIVSLGGDGTMLRTVSLVAACDVPVIGVNFGQLGYLTDVEPEQLNDVIQSVLQHAEIKEERMLLQVEVLRGGKSDNPEVFLALNEAVVEKTSSGQTIRLDIALDGAKFTPYEADGVIIATPTGSTAYAFSARGPIVEPTHRAILLTPVSPHMLFDRTLVLDDDSDVVLTVAENRTGSLVIDGRTVGDLHAGDAVRCTASKHRAHLVLSSPRDFHAILKAKFGLSDR